LVEQQRRVLGGQKIVGVLAAQAVEEFLQAVPAAVPPQQRFQVQGRAETLVVLLMAAAAAAGALALVAFRQLGRQGGTAELETLVTLAGRAGLLGHLQLLEAMVLQALAAAVAVEGVFLLMAKMVVLVAREPNIH
jgi:hypothetical protein